MRGGKEWSSSDRRRKEKVRTVKGEGGGRQCPAQDNEKIETREALGWVGG